MIPSISTHFGEIAALLAALFWSISSVLFRRLGNTIRPIELNLIKGVLAVILLGTTSLILREPTPALDILAVILLIISGAVGIGFGDTMYFEALNKLGPRRTLLMGILAPPITAVLASIFLKENLSVVSWLGIVLTMLGVAWVITEKPADSVNKTNLMWIGVLFGFLSAVSQAVGAVISRWALTQTDVTALQSALIRLVAGIAFLVVWVAVSRQKVGEWVKTQSTPKLWGTVLVVVFLGTYLAIWLQQVSFKYTEVGIAQTLLATSPLFILPIMALQKEKISVRAILGALVSTAGVCLLFLVR